MSDNGHIRVECPDGWFDIKNLRHITYGEAREIRKQAAGATDEDASERILLSCLIAWDLKDAHGEQVTEINLDNLYRLSPRTVGLIGDTVTKELQPQIPLPSPKESVTS